MLVGYGAALLAWPAPAGRDPTASAALSPAVEAAVDRTLQSLEPLAQRCGSMDPPDWRAFARAVQAAGEPVHPLVVWAPAVPETARAGYEADTGRDAFRSFLIREPDGRAGLRAAAARDAHFPVHLVDPAPRSNALLGLDLPADPALAEAIARAGQSGAPQLLLSGKALLPGSSSGPLLVMPVLRGGRLAGVLVAAVPAAVPPGAAPRLVTRPWPR